MFVVDWGDLAPLPCYPTAAYNTKYVGKCTADLLLRYAQQYPEFKPYEMHGIGFSLGAHLVSFVSNRILFQTGRKLSRITGEHSKLIRRFGENLIWSFIWYRFGSGTAIFRINKSAMETRFIRCRLRRCHSHECRNLRQNWAFWTLGFLREWRSNSTAVPSPQK